MHGDIERAAPAGRVPGPEQLMWPYDPVVDRATAVCVLAACALVLGLAFLLPPSPSGWGTHHRLHLAPCMFHYLTGVPCPFCGMTTAFAHMARGEVRAALSCHALGPAVYAGAWLAGLWAAFTLITRRRFVPPGWMSARAHRVLIVIVLVAWGVNILRALA